MFKDLLCRLFFRHERGKGLASSPRLKALVLGYLNRGKFQDNSYFFK